MKKTLGGHPNAASARTSRTRTAAVVVVIVPPTILEVGKAYIDRVDILVLLVRSIGVFAQLQFFLDGPDSAPKRKIRNNLLNLVFNFLFQYNYQT